MKWVDEEISSTASFDSSQKRPKKKRVVEVEDEPLHSVIPGHSIDIDLIFSANCNYAKYSCVTDRIYFKETYIFQTRVFKYVP